MITNRARRATAGGKAGPPGRFSAGRSGRGRRRIEAGADVASRLQISIRKVAEIAQSGRLPVVRVDGAVRFREEDVLRLLTENQEPRPRVLALAPRIRSGM